MKEEDFLSYLTFDEFGKNVVENLITTNGGKHEVLCCVKNVNVVESEQKRFLAGV